MTSIDIAGELLAKEPAHPLLPLPAAERVVALLGSEAGQAELAELLAMRRTAILNANADPLRAELEPEFWADVRAAIAERIRLAIILGGNRSSKSWLCAKLAVGAMMEYPGTMILAVSEDETASRETQQKIIWHYLPPEIKRDCHNKLDSKGIFYVRYSEANGFGERKLVLPLPRGHDGAPSKMLFATYGENPDDYEGLEFGHPTEWTVTWWADENLRLGWLNMFTRRGRFRPGTGLWSYTPIHGITPTIKEAVGSARTLQWKPARLLSDRVNIPGGPVGQMPYIQEPAAEGRRVFYFHSEMSPFGPGPNGSGKPYAESVAEDCAGKPSEYVKRIAYGFTEDVIGRCYPQFNGSVHVIPAEELPAEGTNYCFIDPAGDRNWFILWVRVPPGNPKRLYIYREWPDAGRYGEWAVPTSRAVTQDSRKGWDGERGPAQRGQGWGVPQYKKLLLEEEAVGAKAEKDPYRRRLRLLAEGHEGGALGESALPTREAIRCRKVDPRAAANPHAGEQAGVNMLTLFAQEQKNGKGEVIGPRMTLLPAYTGKGIDDGIMHVNELLSYDQTQPVCPVLNEPRLYVCRDCRNVIWMFENYTNQGGEDGGCKDPADLVRYIAQDDDVRHVADGGKMRVGGFREGF